jgi:hypothetical protein
MSAIAEISGPVVLTMSSSDRDPTQIRFLAKQDSPKVSVSIPKDNFLVGTTGRVIRLLPQEDIPMKILITALAMFVAVCSTSNAQVSCQQVVNVTYCNNGQTFQRNGNYTYDNRGNSWQRSGNYIYGSDGTTYQRNGTVTYGSDGTTYRRGGNYIYGSNGTTCRRVGAYTYCD